MVAQQSFLRGLVEVMFSGRLDVARVGCDGKISVEGEAVLRDELLAASDLLSLDKVVDVADFPRQFSKVGQLGVWVGVLHSAHKRIPTGNMRARFIAAVDREHLIESRTVVMHRLTALQHTADVLIE